MKNVSKRLRFVNGRQLENCKKNNELNHWSIVAGRFLLHEIKRGFHTKRRFNAPRH